VLRRFLGRRQNVQPPENDLGAPAAIPLCERVGAMRECQVHGDADDLGKRIERRRALQQILVPVPQCPVLGRAGCHGRQRQRRRQDMFAEAGMRILAVEGIDQERVTTAHGSRDRL
jgi:hypothetical protein